MRLITPAECDELRWVCKIKEIDEIYKMQFKVARVHHEFIVCLHP